MGVGPDSGMDCWGLDLCIFLAILLGAKIATMESGLSVSIRKVRLT